MARLKPADYLFWAVRQQTGNPIRNLILIQLCNRAGKKGTCFPSLQTISDDCGVAKRSVIRHIRELEKEGFISIRKRATNGVNNSSLYSFPLANSMVTESHHVVTESHKGSDRGSLGVVTEMPIKHPLVNTQLNTHKPPIAPFDEFYDAYPKKVGRKDAEKAWKKLSPDHALINRIMQDIKNRVEQGHWCTGEGKQYIPGPAPYLNQQRWEDEIIPRPEFKAPTDYSALASSLDDVVVT